MSSSTNSEDSFRLPDVGDSEGCFRALDEDRRRNIARTLRDLADEVEPDDWMHDSMGRPL